ncbi:MAG: hypothetical protein QXF61_08955 [Nitrososphaeria archaeon]
MKGQFINLIFNPIAFKIFIMRLAHVMSLYNKEAENCLHEIDVKEFMPRKVISRAKSKGVGLLPINLFIV